MAWVLVVDDDASIRITLREFLMEDGHEVQVATDAQEALSFMEKSDLDVVVTDIILPGINGVDLLKKIREITPGIQVIIFTGQPNISTASAAIRAGAFDYLSKPISPETIRDVVAKAARVKQSMDRKRWTEHENQRHKQHLQDQVTKRTQALLKSEQKFRDLTNLLPQTVFEADLQGNVLYANYAAYAAYGYTKEGFLKGANLRHSVVLEQQETLMAHVGRVLEGESSRGEEYLCIRKDESTFPALYHLSRVCSSHGQAIGLRGIIIDISKQKEAQKSLEESESQYRTLVEGASDGIYIVRNRRFVYINRSFREMFDYSEEEFFAMTDFLEIVDESSHGFFQERKQRRENGLEVESRYRFTGKRKGGEKITLETRIVPVSYQGKPAYQGILRDISREQEYQKKLAEEFEKRHNLIVNTSHLLNTPLTIALGYLDIIKLGFKDMSLELMEKIHGNLLKIEGLIRGELAENIASLTRETYDGWNSKNFMCQSEELQDSKEEEASGNEEEENVTPEN